MSLLRLPPETLTQIFDEIGSSFFHQDLRRLTVCKQWFEFALPACFKCITLSQEALRSLIASGVMKRLSPLKDSLATLKLELREYGACISTSYPREDAQGSNDLVDTWIEVHSDLVQLATIARQSRRLRALHIRAWGYPSLEFLGSPQEYLLPSTMQNLLSLENLSVLVLDLTVGFLYPPEKQGGDCHICPAISTLLCTLRTLHLRMRRICPDVLKPRDTNVSLHLSVVVVNLNLITSQPDITSAAHSKRCGSQAGGLLQLIADVREEGEILAARMASPKTIRILTHSLPHFETQSLDVLTGKTMLLDDDMAWDEDGKTVKEDSEPESELLDSDFSSSDE